LQEGIIFAVFLRLINHLSKTAIKPKSTILNRKTSLTLLFSLCIVLSYAQTANFTANVTSGCSPLVVNFQDQSTGNPTSWFWDFGNGATATLQNPSTTYFTPGIYTVTLTVKNSGGSNTLTRTQYLTIYGKPSVNFITNDSASCFPLRAQFTDLSTPGAGTSNASWLWDFGDGTQSTQQNPLHVYTNTGNYTVNVKVTSDKGCYAVLVKQAYIKVAGGVVANFTNTQPAVCRPPFNISFTNSSTGPGTLTWFWDFGDGTSSTQPNPIHTYTTPGNYTVAFATTSSGGCSDTLRKVNALNIQDIKTTFTAPDSICINTPINFSNTSTPAPVSSNWNFGDGTTSTVINPIKSYPVPNNYTVTLYNTYSYCTDSFSKTIKLLRRPTANFTANTTFKCQPNLIVDFQDQSTNAVNWFWDFGDGATSVQQNPSHTYTNYGNYNVQLVVTNASGCTDTLKKTAYIKIARPVISFPSLPVEGCIPYSLSLGASISTGDAVTSYLWDFGDGSPKDAASNPSHVYTVQGTYPVSLTITTSTGCTETYTLGGAVTVGSIPNVDFTGAPNPVCAIQPVQFTNLSNPAGDKWLWNFGDGSSSISQNPSHQYSDTGLFTVELIVINSGCRASKKITDYIRVKPPIPQFKYTPDCSNRLLFNFIDLSIYDPNNTVSWLWDFGDGTQSVQQNPIHIFPALGSFNVTLTISNGSCSNPITKTITVVNENPDVVANPNPVCRPATVNFSATGVNTANIILYRWDIGTGTFLPTSFPAFSTIYTNSGFYTITLITTDINGCQDTVSKPNYIHITGPVANFSATNRTGCKGLTTTFNDLSQSDGISSIIKWTWDFGDGTAPQTFTSPPPHQHTYLNAGTYSVKLTVTDAGGCSDSYTISNYIITTDPKALFSSADTLACPRSTVQFTNQSTGINFTSVWSFGDGNTSAGFAPSNFYIDTGLYTVKLKITDQYNCSDSLIRSNYIKVQRPFASYSVNDSVSSCTPFEVDFTNTSQYYVSSLWDLGGGISTLKNPIQFYNAPGIYPIRLIVTSPGGCMDTTYGSVHVYDTIGARVTYAPLDGCKPLSVNLDVFTPGPGDYTWDFGDGVLITNDTTKMNHLYNFFGKFVPKVILTDSSGCIIPITGADTIRIKGATVKFGLDKKFFCDSGLVSFIDSTTYNDSLMVYNWDFGDGTISHVQNPSHFYNSPGFYTPSLNVLTENACVDTFRLNNEIKIVQSPLISIAGDSIICLNDFMQHLGVFDRSDTSAVQWSWQFPNGNISDLQNPVLQQYIKEGNFVVQTIVTNSSGCKDTATKNILIHPLPQVSMPSAITMQVGFPITIPATYTSNVWSWTWTTAATLNCGDCPQPVANPKFNTKYTVSFIDSNGCKNTGDIQIIVVCKNENVFVPNTFSPNGDGNNDVFYVRGRGLDRVKSLRIFNRWGEIVFEQQNFPVNNPMYGWDGKFKGNKPIPDVYVYQVEIFCDNSQIVHFEGNIALIQ
jgi:gliding motility-associated-like protein